MAERRGLRIGGIPIHVEWPFFLIAAILGGNRIRTWPGNRFVFLLIWVAIVFVSVLVHELGHAVAYRLNGIRPSITLTAFWGLTHGEETRSRWRSIGVSLAGPLAGMVLLGVPAYLLAPSFHHAYEVQGTLAAWERWQVVEAVAFANIAWSIINLLPVLPLDGGNIANELWGIRVTRVLGIVASGGAAIWFFLTGLSYAAFFFAVLAMMNLGEAMQEGMSWSDVRHGRLGDDEPRARRTRARPETPPNRPASGGSKRGRRRKGPDLTVVPSLPYEAAQATDGPRLEAAAWDALRAGDTDEASRVLLEATGRSGVSPYLPASLAAVEGRSADAIELFQRAFAAVPTPPNLVVATVIGKAGLAVPLTERLLDPTGPGVHAAAELQNHLHYAGCYADAARAGELVVADGRRSVAQSSFEVACSWSKAGEAEQGLEWLVRAVDAGFKAPAVIDSEADLALVRQQPGYAELRARLLDTTT